MLPSETPRRGFTTILWYYWQGCGVGVGGVACFQLESESVFKTAGVRVGFLKLLESGVGFSKLLESGVGTFVAITDSNV